MKLNEIRAKRADVIKQAQGIIEKAEAETRDLTVEEIAQIDGLIGKDDSDAGSQVAVLDGQIARYVRVDTLSAKLTESAAGQTPIVKPGVGTKTAMKRADYEKLSAGERAAFIRDGGNLEE